MIGNPQEMRALSQDLANSTWTLGAIGALLESGLVEHLREPRSADELAARCPGLSKGRIERSLAVAAAAGVVVAEGAAVPPGSGGDALRAAADARGAAGRDPLHPDAGDGVSRFVERPATAARMAAHERRAPPGAGRRVGHVCPGAQGEHRRHAGRSRGAARATRRALPRRRRRRRLARHRDVPAAGRGSTPSDSTPSTCRSVWRDRTSSAPASPIASSCARIGGRGAPRRGVVRARVGAELLHRGPRPGRGRGARPRVAATRRVDALSDRRPSGQRRTRARRLCPHHRALGRPGAVHQRGGVSPQGSGILDRARPARSRLDAAVGRRPALTGSVIPLYRSLVAGSLAARVDACQTCS